MGKLGNAVVWSTVEQFGSRAIGMLVQIVLARILSPEDFGMLAILLVSVNIASAIAQSGLGSALIQKRKIDERSASTVLWLSACLALGLYLIIFFLSSAIASFYEKPSLAVCLKVLALCLFVNSYNSIQRSLLQRRLDFKSLCITSMVATIGAAAVGIGCALAGLGVWSLIAQTLASGVLACIVMTTCTRWRPKLVFDGGQARELFSFGWKMGAAGLLNTLYASTTELIIGKVCSSEQLGYYSQGKKYPEAVFGALCSSLTSVLFPAFAQIADDEEKLIASAKRCLLLGTSFLAPSVMLVIVCAEPLVDILLTDKWLTCVPVFQMIAAQYLLIILQVVNLRVYMAKGRSDVYLAVHVVRDVIGFAVVIPVALMTADIYCVAAAFCIVSVLVTLLVDISPAKRIYGYSSIQQLKDIAPILLVGFVAAVPAGLIQLANIGSVLTLVLQALFYCLIFALLVKMLRISVVKESFAAVGSFVFGKFRR